MLSTFAGGAMFGATFGTNDATVVALHGWRRSHTDFDRILEGFDAISLDLPGFGASPEPNSAWGAELYAHEVARVIEPLPGPVVVVGHSFGGRIAVVLAALRPELVKAIVVTGAPLIRSGIPTKPPLMFRVAKWAHGRGLVTDEYMESLRRSRGSDDYRAASGVMRDVFVRVVNESYGQYLQKVTCPAEFIWGELDTAAPVDQAREAAALVSNCHLEVVANGTHWMLSEQPELLRSSIRKYLS